MSEVRRIVDQMQKAWDGEPFHGPAVGTLLAGIAAQAAFARPLAGAHTIAEIARHIGTWEDIVRRRLAGEVIDQVPDEDDWPSVDATPAGWDAICAERVWARGEPMRLEAAHGADRACLEPVP